MKATKRIRKLLKDLRTFADGDLDASDGGDEANVDPGASPDNPNGTADDAEEVAADAGADAEVSEQDTAADCSTCSTTTDTCSQSSSSVSKVFRDEVERLVQQLGDSRILVATLVAEINILHQERARQDSQHSLVIKRLEEELIKLQRQAHKELALLNVRQDQMELDVPLLEDQLGSLKSVLLDFNVSEKLYFELVATPEEKRSVKAHLQILAYQKMKGLKSELDSIRKERDTSRETLVRENQAVESAKRELQRMKADAALNKRQSENDIASTMARNERLESELREALTNVEVLSAKGSMYDEVKEKLEKADQNAVNTENQKAVMTATLQVLTEEKQRLVEVVKDKDHCLDLLSMDKIYLTREVKGHLDQIKKLEKDLEHQREKMAALKTTKEELYSKVLNDGRGTQAAHEQRLEAELSRLRDRAKQDIEQIRTGATEVAEEKVKTFREMRDAALADAERAHKNLREYKSKHDEILSRYQEFRRVSEAKDIKAQSEMKVRDFEVEQLQIVQKEIRSILNQKSSESESLQEKIKVLTEKCHKLDMESRKAIANLTYDLETANTNHKTLMERYQKLEEQSGKPFAVLQHKLEDAQTLVKIYEERLELHENRAMPTFDRSPDDRERRRRNVGKREKQSSSRKAQKLFLKAAPENESGKGPSPNKLKGKEEIQEVLQEVVQASSSRKHEKEDTQIPVHPLASRVTAAEVGEKQRSHQPGQSQPPERNLESELRQARTENEHVCQRLHDLQRDLKRILQARGTMENFQTLLRGKGIHISDQVIRRITRSRPESVT